MRPGGFYGDSLQVLISNDCGETWQTLFNKGGYELITNSNVNQHFYPQSDDQWVGEEIVIEAFSGKIGEAFSVTQGAIIYPGELLYFSEKVVPKVFFWQQFVHQAVFKCFFCINGVRKLNFHGL